MNLPLIDPGAPKRSSLNSALRWRHIWALRVELNQKIPIHSVIGLPLLYASAYFLPPLTPTGAYLLPSRDLLGLIIFPSLLAVVAGSALVYTISVAARRSCNPRVAAGTAVLVLSLLTLIGLKGILDVAGYRWEDHLPHSEDMVATVRIYKSIAFCAVLALVWATRSALPQLNRLLTSLGFAFGLLAAIRLFILWNAPLAIPASTAVEAMSAMQSVRSNSFAAVASQTIGDVRPRRVVWIIFDETDFDRIYTEHPESKLELTNFTRLARMSVFATNANSPASATIYSIPALLAGVPIAGQGIQIDESASLWLERPDATLMPFSEPTSIFGALTARGQSASVLGFYHPYCKLFKLQRCDSFAWPAIGGLTAAIWANIPDFISTKLRHRQADAWYTTTQESLRLLPQYLARDDAFTFVHLNFPHLPAIYADRALHLRASSDPLTEYSHNLMLADQVLGEIVQDLQRRVLRHELLLVVSTDHWFRNRWYQPSVPESSRPVPFIVWKVGETKGFTLSQPVSTVHTAAMIIDYLSGNLSTQADIAQWWTNRPVSPSFIAPDR